MKSSKENVKSPSLNCAEIDRLVARGHALHGQAVYQSLVRMVVLFRNLWQLVFAADQGSLLEPTQQRRVLP